MKKILTIFMAMALVFALSIPCFASESEELGIPNPSSVWVDGAFPYAVVVVSDTDYSLYLMPTKADVGTTANLKVYAGYRRYDLLNGIWTLAVDNGGSQTSVAGYNLVWSSYDVMGLGDFNDDGKFEEEFTYFESNPNFFPEPLFLQVQKVTTETLTTETLPTMGGTMTTLTLCGVGLMALLVVLSLFGKRSLLFRG